MRRVDHVDLPELVHVGEKHRGRHDIVKGRTSGLENRFDVSEHLAGLRFDPALDQGSRSWIEGNLTGCVYSDSTGRDDDVYDKVAGRLRQRVGRLLNDKMPTGVAVSPAMHHGGPYPSTGHPGFTAVGLPAAMLRFARLHCYDNVRPLRLPTGLRDKNPTGKMWRSVDGVWTQADVVR